MKETLKMCQLNAILDLVGFWVEKTPIVKRARESKVCMPIVFVIKEMLTLKPFFIIK